MAFLRNLTLEKKVLYGLIFASILFRVFYFLNEKAKADYEIDQKPYPWSFVQEDTTTFYSLALNLAQFKKFGKQEKDHFEYNTFHMPLYPIVILGVNSFLDLNETPIETLHRDGKEKFIYVSKSALWLSAINHAVGVISLVVFFKLLLLMNKSILTSSLGTFIFSFYPSRLAMDQVALADSFVILFCLLSCLYIINFSYSEKIKQLILSAFWLNLAVMTKPVGLPFYLFICLAFIFKFKISLKLIKYSTIFLLSANLFSAVWMYRNGSLTNVYVTSSFQHKTPWELTAKGILMEKGLSLKEANLEVERLGDVEVELLEKELNQNVNHAQLFKARYFAAQKVIFNNLYVLTKGLIKYTPKIFRPRGVVSWFFAFLTYALFILATIWGLRESKFFPLVLFGGILLFFSYITFPFTGVRFEEFFRPYIILISFMFPLSTYKAFFQKVEVLR